MSVIFYTGDIWEPIAVITRGKDNTKVDPTVKITVTQPNGTVVIVAATMTKEAVGEYVAQVPLTEAGKWRCDIDTTGSYVGTKPESITVRPR